jgi:hypothetical protein
VEGSFSLDALGYVDGELDTVVTESAGGDSAVNGSTAVAAEDTGLCQYSSVVLIGRWQTHVALVTSR